MHDQKYQKGQQLSPQSRISKAFPKEFDAFLVKEMLKQLYFRLVKKLGDVFRKTKEWLHENQVTGIVYKVECKLCPFVYIGESKRYWNSRGAEHKPGNQGNNESAIKQHVEGPLDMTFIQTMWKYWNATWTTETNAYFWNLCIPL